jgi:hypothetical protein
MSNTAGIILTLCAIAAAWGLWKWKQRQSDAAQAASQQAAYSALGQAVVAGSGLPAQVVIESPGAPPVYNPCATIAGIPAPQDTGMGRVDGIGP